MSDAPPHLLPDNATWSGIMLLVIAGLFLAAAVIGIVVRLVMPEKFDATDGSPKSPEHPAD